MKSNNKQISPLKAAILAYVLSAEQMLQDDSAAEEMAMIDEASPRELEEFHNYLKHIAEQVRNQLLPD